MSDQLYCPSCGAPFEISNRFVKVVSCDFCDNVSVLKNDSWDPTGRRATLATGKSLFFVDAVGSIDGRRFKVVGRLRYEYEDGRWDEWFLEFEDGEPGWLVEDEGRYRFFTKTTMADDDVPYFDDVAAGSTIEVGEYEMFVTETGEAKITGSEGQLAFAILPGETIYYVDGTLGEDERMSVEYATDEVEVLIGKDVPRESIAVDEDEYAEYY